MLDRVDTGADRRIDAGRAMSVGSDANALHVRLVRDGAKLILGQLLLARRVAAREDAARRADLDDLGAELALAADLVLQLVDTVADALFLRRLLQLGRQIGVVAVTAGRAECMTGRDDARADNIARLDRLLQPDVHPIARPDDPHGREPAIEHVARRRALPRQARSCRYIRGSDSRRCPPG